MSYSYSPELKAPQKMPDIDPGKAAMAGMLKILCLTHQKQTAAFRPPEGLACRKISVQAADGAQIPCFVVEPESSDDPLPGVLMIHGGGFYLPVQTSALALGCEYARGLNARVFLPEYRLVPQFTAPTQLNDCMAVWLELQRHAVDPSRLLVIGDSAGAALTAGLCIGLCGRACPQPKGQMLIYPVMDDRVELYASDEKYADACWSPKATKA
ncbi:MAG: alpha/beta hydrolase, partial [Candidatus Faecousia sp.]|nr:alpha/beta hydrolase [Candidatus Faecousia sp.]